MIYLAKIICLIMILTNSSYAQIEIYSAGERFKSFEDYKKSTSKVLLDDIELPTGHVQSDFKEDLISQISFNQDFDRSLIHFSQDWKSARFIDMLEPDRLQTVLEQTVGKSQQAVLLISDPQKIRIMSFESESRTPLELNSVIEAKG